MASTYSSTLDRLLIEQSWPTLDTDKKCQLFQASALEAATIAGQNVKTPKAKRFST